MGRILTNYKVHCKIIPGSHSHAGSCAMYSSNRFGWFRSFVMVSGVGLVYVLVVGVTCGQGQVSDAVLGPVAAKTISIADAHFHVNALTTTKDPSAQIKTRADSPIVKTLFALAGKYNRPLNIHAQWDSDTAREIELLAESNRSARLVLAHCGSFATPVQIRGVFERHTNVSCDLSVRGVPPLQGRNAIHAAFDDRGIRGSWKNLIEDYPDRFIVGVDNVYSWEGYENVIRSIRFGLLANVSPATAEKVAHKNAQAWFRLE